MSVPERNSGSEGKEEESEDESEILEESPCGRWQKRKDKVRLKCAFCHYLDSVCILEQRQTVSISIEFQNLLKSPLV